VTTPRAAVDRLDHARVDAFVDRFAATVAGALHAVTVLVGDRLGLYQAMADGAPVTAAELAERTGTSPGHVAAWLDSQVEAAYVDAERAGTFRLPPEHAAVLAGEVEGVPVAGALLVLAAAFKDEPLVTEAFRTGAAPARRDHHPDLDTGLARCREAAQAGPGAGAPTLLPPATAASLFINFAIGSGDAAPEHASEGGRR
jgi:hypothetical protein